MRIIRIDVEAPGTLATLQPLAFHKNLNDAFGFRHGGLLTIRPAKDPVVDRAGGIRATMKQSGKFGLPVGKRETVKVQPTRRERRPFATLCNSITR